MPIPPRPQEQEYYTPLSAISQVFTDNFFRLSSSPYASDLARHTSVHPIGKQRIKLRKTKVRNPSARIQRAVFFRHALPQQKAANQSMKEKVQPSRRDSTHRRLPAHSPLVENAESIQRNEGAQTLRQNPTYCLLPARFPAESSESIDESEGATHSPGFNPPAGIQRTVVYQRTPSLVENAESIQRNEGAQPPTRIQRAVFYRHVPRQKQRINRWKRRCADPSSGFIGSSSPYMRFPDPSNPNSINAGAPSRPSAIFIEKSAKSIFVKP